MFERIHMHERVLTQTHTPVFGILILLQLMLESCRKRCHVQLALLVI